MFRWSGKWSHCIASLVSCDVSIKTINDKSGLSLVFTTCLTSTILYASLYMYSCQEMCLLSSHLRTHYVFVPNRSLTRNTTRPGTASLGETLAATWLMRPSISFTSTWVRWPFCCSSPAEGTHSLHISWPYIQYWLTRQRHLSFLGKGPLPFSVLLSTLLSLRIKKTKTKRGHVKEMKHLYLFLSCYIRHVIFLIKA